MKSTVTPYQVVCSFVLFLIFSSFVQAAVEDFEYTIADNAVTITSYIGTGSYVVVPEMIEGLPVVALGEGFSLVNSELREITIPATVTTIAENALRYGRSLEVIHVDIENVAFSSLEGVLFNKDQTELIYYPRMKPELVYSVPDGVTHIGDYAFASRACLQKKEEKACTLKKGCRYC